MTAHEVTFYGQTFEFETEADLKKFMTGFRAGRRIRNIQHAQRIRRTGRQLIQDKRNAADKSVAS